MLLCFVLYYECLEIYIFCCLARSSKVIYFSSISSPLNNCIETYLDWVCSHTFKLNCFEWRDTNAFVPLHVMQLKCWASHSQKSTSLTSQQHHIYSHKLCLFLFIASAILFFSFIRTFLITSVYKICNQLEIVL